MINGQEHLLLFELRQIRAGSYDHNQMVSLVQFGALCVGGGQGPSNYDRCTFLTKRYSDDVVSVGPTNVCRFVSILIEIPMNCALQVNSIIGDFPILKVQEAMQYLKKKKEPPHNIGL